MNIDAQQCPLRYGAINTPDAPVIKSFDSSISYIELDQLTEYVSQQLNTNNFKKGDVFACVGNNSIELIALMLASIRLGIIFLPINPKFSPQQIDDVLNKTGAKAVWLHDDTRQSSNDNACFVTYSANQLSLDFNLSNLGNARNDACLHELEPIFIEQSQPATAILTSGSTGTPKAAVHSLANHYFSALGSQVNLPLSDGDCWLLSLPMFHISGMSIVFRVLFSGATIGLVENRNSGSDAKQNTLLESFCTLPITHASLVAAQAVKLIQAPELNSKAKLKYLLLGGSAMPKALLTALSKTSIKAFYSYGLTEMASQVATIAVTEKYFKTPLPHRTLKIERDELLVGGETLFLGYLESGTLSQASSSGWFYTKDLVEQTQAGFRIIGRKDNMFNSGGESYQPEVVEAIINAHKSVKACVIVPVQDEVYGEVACAFIDWQTPNEEKQVLEAQLQVQEMLVAQLKHDLTEQVANYQVPKIFLPWAQQPNAGIKINRTWYKQHASMLLAR